MAVEIKELVIKAVATKDPSLTKTSQQPQGMGMSDAQIDRIIAACVREILHILKRKQAR